LEENVPEKRCDLHTLVALDARTGEPADSSTPPNYRVLRPITRWPAEVLQWAIDAGLTEPHLVRLAPGSVVTEHSDDEPRLYLTAPEDGGTFRISPQLPLESQQLRLAAVCERCQAGDTLTVQIDGEDWHSWSDAPYTGLWTLQEGTHEFSLVRQSATGDREGSAIVTITVTQDAQEGSEK